MNQRVPLRTGRVFYAVAWAVSEGPDSLDFCDVLLWVIGSKEERRGAGAGKSGEGCLICVSIPVLGGLYSTYPQDLF